MKRILCLLGLFALAGASKAQGLPNLPIHGNVQLDAQYYFEDSLIGAPDVPEQMLFNGFANFTYEKDNFSAGLRYESYQNPILGFDKRYKGSGIPYRFLRYKNNELDITAGTFYEQFGSGILLRAYEERGLGYDNAIDGFRFMYNPAKGVYFKGVIGKQRDFFNLGQGIVRGGDVEWVVNESFESRAAAKTQWIIGGNYVSKYQSDEDPTFRLPENVGSGYVRVSFTNGGWSASAEYAYKANDPSASNGFIFKEGQALLLNASYTKKGFGFVLGAKRIDNMSFRSDRYATVNSLLVNYLPALTKNHTYLMAAFYPYATQPNGEFGFQGELFYKLKPGGLGGKYGTDINLNYSRAQSIEKKAITDPEQADLGYTSDFFALGKEVYFEDFNIELNRKLSKEVRLVLTYLYQNYNRDVIEGRTGFGHIYSHIGIAEVFYRISPKKNFRTELQHMYTEQNTKSWAVLLAEYTVAPHWFVAAFDQWNYGNDDSNERFHYITGQFGYTRGSNRVVVGYGRQRPGILCVGGVCRNVPAANGFTLSVTSSF